MLPAGCPGEQGPQGVGGAEAGAEGSGAHDDVKGAMAEGALLGAGDVATPGAARRSAAGGGVVEEDERGPVGLR